MCVLNISVWFIYIWGLCGYEGQTTIYVSVACWCNVMFVTYGKLLRQDMCIYLSVCATCMYATRNICNVYRCDIYLYVYLYLYICVYVSICMCYIYMYIYLYLYLHKSTSIDNNVPLGFALLLLILLLL